MARSKPAKPLEGSRVTADDKLEAERLVEQGLSSGKTAETFDPLAIPGEDQFPEATARPKAAEPENPHPVGSLEHLRIEQAKYLAAPHTAAEKCGPAETRDELAVRMHEQLSGLASDVPEDTLTALIDLATEAVMVERDRCVALVELVGARIEAYGEFNSPQGCAVAAARLIRAGHTPLTAPTND